MWRPGGARRAKRHEASGRLDSRPMEALSLDRFERAAADYDACVAQSADVDLFCTSSDWILPAAAAFGVSGAPWIRRGPQGFAALMEVELQGGLAALQPLEAVWGLACPVIGADVEPLALEFADELAKSPQRRHVLLLCGLERDSTRFHALVRALVPRYELRLGPETRRYVASLENGVDGFLARRSANFRDSIRKATRRAALERVSFTRCDPRLEDAPAVYERLLAIERESWKGHEGVGLEASAMVEFYRAMVPRLIRRGALRLVFATRDGEDLAYILGGLFAGTYRGLQFSFREGFENLSLGNLCQMEQIASLAEEVVALYDLGTDVEYKKRWGEIEHETVTVIAFPR